MKHRFITTVAVILSTLLLTSCFSGKRNTLTGAQAYIEAIKNLNGTDFIATVSKTEAISTGTESITQTTTAEITVADFKEPNMCTKSMLNAASRKHSFTADEVYIDGTVYLNVNGGLFSASAENTASAIRYLSPALLDPNCFTEIQHQYSDGRQIIGFSQATQPLPGTVPVDAQFQVATGSAILLSDGTLYETSYSVTYIHDFVTVAYTVTARFDMQYKSDITIPENADAYIPVTNTEDLLLLESACAKLLGLSAVSSHTTYDILCEAGGLQRTQEITTQISDCTDGFYAQVNTQVDLLNQSLQGTVSSFSQTETFSDGKYSLTTSSTNEPTAPVSEDAMRTYCKNNLVSSVMLPQYIHAVVATEDDSSYYLTFQASEQLAQHLFTNAYQSLYADQATANNLVDTYETQNISGHIEISKSTGLPICAGLSYVGAATIDAASHEFRVNVEQTYSYSK